MTDVFSIVLPLAGNVVRTALKSILRAKKDMTRQEAGDLLLQFLAEVIGTDDDMNAIQARLDARIPPE